MKIKIFYSCNGFFRRLSLFSLVIQNNFSTFLQIEFQNIILITRASLKGNYLAFMFKRASHRFQHTLYEPYLSRESERKKRERMRELESSGCALQMIVLHLHYTFTGIHPRGVPKSERAEAEKNLGIVKMRVYNFGRTGILEQEGSFDSLKMYHKIGIVL